MKILLRSKFYKVFGGTEKIGGGLIAALENQRKMLTSMEVPFTEDMDSDWDIMQVNIPWPAALREINFAKKKGKKVVMWSHVTVEDLEKSVRVFRMIPALSSIVRKYLKYAYGHADMVLCPSQYTKDLLVKYGLPENKLYVQSNAVDTAKYYKDETRRENYRKQYGLSGIVVGNVSLVIPRKGPSTFIDLSRKFTNNQFIWFGKIFNKLFVEGLPKTNLSHLRFTDFIEDPVAALNAIDIFLFPSLEENQGMVILEAAAIGLPILVRDISVYNGWLVHNVNCLKAKNDSEFEIHLKNLLEDEDLRARLSKEALVLAQGESLDSQGTILKKTYSNLFQDNK